MAQTIKAGWLRFSFQEQTPSLRTMTVRFCPSAPFTNIMRDKITVVNWTHNPIASVRLALSQPYGRLAESGLMRQTAIGAKLETGETGTEFKA
jgi:hypothetical protein